MSKVNSTSKSPTKSKVDPMQASKAESMAKSKAESMAKSKSDMKSKSVPKKVENKENKENEKNDVPKIIPCSLKLENFPSRGELLKTVDELLSKNNYDSNSYHMSNGSNQITFSFKDSEICFCLVKELNIIKFTNSLYGKLKINVEFSTKNPNRINQSQSLGNINSKKKRQRKLKTETDIPRPVLRSTSVFIGEPYVDPAKKLYKEYVEGKMKWMSPKGFQIRGNLNTLAANNEIGNYVNLDPFQENVFVLRKKCKEKWVDEGGFKIKRPDRDIFNYMGEDINKYPVKVIKKQNKTMENNKTNNENEKNTTENKKEKKKDSFCDRAKAAATKNSPPKDNAKDAINAELKSPSKASKSPSKGLSKSPSIAPSIAASKAPSKAPSKAISKATSKK